MIEVALADKTEKEGLDVIKELAKHSKRIKFDNQEQIHEFVDSLNNYSERETEGVTYQYKPMNNTQSAPQIQVRSSK